MSPDQGRLHIQMVRIGYCVERGTVAAVAAPAFRIEEKKTIAYSSNNIYPWESALQPCRRGLFAISRHEGLEILAWTAILIFSGRPK